jgi:hypothetical protein
MCFFHSAGGMDWKHKKDWGTAAPIQQWQGITLNGEANIEEIHLESNHISGTAFLNLKRIFLMIFHFVSNRKPNQRNVHLWKFEVNEYVK